MRLVEVAVAAPVRKTFTYVASPDQELKAGMRVLVPFGRKLLTGYVVGFPKDTSVNLARLRAIRKILDFEPILAPELMQLGFWLSHYYIASPGEVFRSMLPAGLNFRGDYEISLLRVSGQKSLLEDEDRIVAILQKGPLRFESLARRLGRANLWSEIQKLRKEGVIAVREHLVEKSPEKTALFVALLEAPADCVLTVLQKVAVEKLRALPSPIRLAELARSGVSLTTVRSLEKKRRVNVERRAIRRSPLHVDIRRQTEFFTLTPSQADAVRRIRECVVGHEFQSFLLHGVTGSGKTEVYLHAIAAALEAGRGALMLVPEIALTPALTRTFQGWFGEHVGILHSGLSAGERHDEWQRIRHGEARVVIGTRSAVFCPLQNLGVIIVDEEHDPSYKQEENPMYNGRDTALVRGRSARAAVVLGSATPSLETYFHACEAGKHQYIAMNERVQKRPLANVQIVDMRTEFQKHGKATVISTLLQGGVRDCLDRKEQVMILLNRRGYAPVLLCRSCGNVGVCDQCSVSLTYHQAERRLICHYCGYWRGLPGACEQCGGEYLYFVGEGTERIQEILQQLFPHASVDRLDRDAARIKGGHYRILHRFDCGETQILVGTQMIAKGHDFPNVTLVGVLNADAGLRVPDFRSAERTFQLITQVAGRAGRGAAEGQVVVQTYYPNHYALRYACMQDYRLFYQQEIRYRKLFSYPPFSSLGTVLTQDPQLDACMERAGLFAAELKRAMEDLRVGGEIRVLGPAEAMLGKLKGLYRVQIVLKAAGRQLLHQVLEATLQRLEAGKNDTSRWSIDIDPIQIA